MLWWSVGGREAFHSSKIRFLSFNEPMPLECELNKSFSGCFCCCFVAVVFPLLRLNRMA